MINDDLIAAIWTKRSLYRLGNRSASVNLGNRSVQWFCGISRHKTCIANDCSIFGIVAVVSLLEQPLLRGLRNGERHDKKEGLRSIGFAPSRVNGRDNEPVGCLEVEE